MKMETLQQRRDELERKEQKLKESLLKFDKFVKVNFNMYCGCSIPIQMNLSIYLSNSHLSIVIIYNYY